MIKIGRAIWMHWRNPAPVFPVQCKWLLPAVQLDRKESLFLVMKPFPFKNRVSLFTKINWSA